jgi:hypothetical protein
MFETQVCRDIKGLDAGEVVDLGLVWWGLCGLAFGLVIREEDT